MYMKFSNAVIYKKEVHIMLGQEIKKYLNSRGISQTFVSEKTGIKQPILSAALNGSRKLLATEYFAICGALSVPLDYFTTEQKAS